MEVLYITLLVTAISCIFYDKINLETGNSDYCWVLYEECHFFFVPNYPNYAMYEIKGKMSSLCPCKLYTFLAKYILNWNWLYTDEMRENKTN